MVSETVGRIEVFLEEVFSLQRPYVARTCAKCQSPCCARVRYLFNEKDMIFLRLSGRAPRWRKGSATKRGCRFLGKNGCALDLPSRPFLCHTYLCDDLRAEMRKDNPKILAYLKEGFRKLHEMRSRLWSEYLDEQL